jgi:GTP-binding protein
LTHSEIISDPAYPGEWRVSGEYIEQIARMTHWEYPEAVERFGRQLVALGIATELQQRGAEAGDLVMVDKFDFEFSPGRTSVYIPPELLEKEATHENPPSMSANGEELAWRPFPEGGYLDVDVEELIGFNEHDDWDLLDDDEFEDDSKFAFSEDEVWTS